MLQSIKVNTKAHSQALDITADVEKLVRLSEKIEGWCEIFVPHTTAAVAVNEAADPSVMEDVLTTLDKLVPWNGGYRHREGNSAAHVKSVLTGATVRIPVLQGRLALGTWQGIFFMEYDGPRERKVYIEVTGREEEF